MNEQAVKLLHEAMQHTAKVAENMGNAYKSILKKLG